MSLEVDSAHHTKCSVKAIRNGYGVWFASYLVLSLIMLFFYRKVQYLTLYAGGRRHFGFRAKYCLSSLGFCGKAPPGDIARYATCRLSFFVLYSLVPGTSLPLFSHWLCSVRTKDHFWSPFPCFVLCFFVPGTLTYAVFPSGENNILYADGRRHLTFWRHTACIALDCSERHHQAI